MKKDIKNLNKFTSNFIVSSRGQLDYPGMNTLIPNANGRITMKGVKQNVLGIDDLGNKKIMKPKKEYQFPGDSVYEIPLNKRGGQFKKGLVNNPKKTKKDLASKKYSRSLNATNVLFTENFLFKKPKSRKNKVFDPNAKYYAEGGESECQPDEYWDGKKCVKLSKNAFVTSDPDEYAFRKASHDDSLNLFKAYQFQKNISERKDSDYEPVFDIHKGNKSKASDWYKNIKDDTKKAFSSYDEYKKASADFDKFTTKPNWTTLIKKEPYKSKYEWTKSAAAFKNTDDFKKLKISGDYNKIKYYESLKFSNPNDVVIGRYSSADIGHKKIKPVDSYWGGKGYNPVYKKPVQEVILDQNQDIINNLIYENPKLEEEILNLTFLKPSLIQQQNYQLQGNNINEEKLELPNEEVESEYLEEGSPDTENAMEWVNKRKYNIDWDGLQIPFRLPRFRKPGSYGPLIKKGKQRYINLPTIESRNTAYLRPKKQDGGNTDAMNGMMKARLAYANEFGNPAAKRMINIPDNPYQFDNGDIGTHYMASYDNYAVPQIQDENGVLVLGDYGPESNEAIRFDSDEDANYFAENYKNVSPGFINKKQDGGINKFDGGSEPENPFDKVQNLNEVTVYGNQEKIKLQGSLIDRLKQVKKAYNDHRVNLGLQKQKQSAEGTSSIISLKDQIQSYKKELDEEKKSYDKASKALNVLKKYNPQSYKKAKVSDVLNATGVDDLRNLYKEGKISDATFMDFYDNFGKSYDREATRTTEEDQVKLEDSWYGQPDEEGRTRWMGNPNNVSKVAQTVAIGAPLAAAAPMMAPAVVSTLANPYVAGGLNAYFAGHGINEFSDPNSLTRKSMSRAYDDPTGSNIGDAAFDVGINSLNFVGLPFNKAIKGTKNLINNTYKINPWAFKPNPEAYYRGIGEAGYKDAIESGVLRVNQNPEWTNALTGKKPDVSTSSPYFFRGDNFNGVQEYNSNIIAEVTGQNMKSRNFSNLINTLSDKPIPSVYQPVKEVGRLGKFKIVDKVSEIPIGENTKFLKQDWLKGYKEVPKELPGSSNVSFVDDVVKQPWQMEELPGLHLQSTMEGEAISKIVDKTGKINTEQALAIIAKESGGADKVALIKQGLGETIPKKMDYNEFRKTVQEQLIPLERQFSEEASNYGLGKIGYPSPKRSSFKSAIENNKLEIARLEEAIAKNPKVTAQDIDELNFTRYSLKLSKKQLLTTEEQFFKLPLENQTLILSNKGKFGTGSSAHGNPEETLGHIHFLRDAQHPDIAIATQMQSDPFQGTHRIMPKVFDKEKELKNLVNLENIAKIQEETAKTAKQISDDIFEFPDGLKIDKTTLENIGKTQKEYNAMKKAEIENFTQKSLLDKNHEERFLQEFMDYAGKRGDLNYIAIPKSETAAKVQGYFKTQKNNANKGDIVTLNNGTTGTIFAKSDNAMVIKHSDGTMENIKLEYVDPKDLFGNMTFPIKNVNGKPFEVHRSYSPEQQTILKKYTEYEKMAKKLGWEIDNITIKGNEYTRIKIPKKFKEGKGEIKAFSTIGTGVLGLGLGATQYKQGGATNDYVDVELTPKEVKDLIAQGYVIEALN